MLFFTYVKSSFIKWPRFMANNCNNNINNKVTNTCAFEILNWANNQNIPLCCECRIKYVYWCIQRQTKLLPDLCIIIHNGSLWLSGFWTLNKWRCNSATSSELAERTMDNKKRAYTDTIQSQNEWVSGTHASRSFIRTTRTKEYVSL